MDIELPGIWTALATPFKEDGQICYESLNKLINYQINSGVKGLLTTGTTGESPTLSESEILAITTHTLKRLNRQLPLIAGIGSYNTHHTIELALKLEQLGVSGFSLILPYYNKPTQEGIYQHVSTIAETLKLPISIYCNPTRCGVQIEPQTLKKLIDHHPSIIGIKDCGASIDRLNRLTSYQNAHFSVLTGDDNWLMAACALGAKGAMSVVSNCIPKDWSLLVQYMFSGDLLSAQKIHTQAIPLIQSLFTESNPIPVKYALYKMGIFNTPQTRLPLTPLSYHLRENVEQALTKFQFI